MSDRLELREFSLADADLLREVAANAEPEAIPPGVPSDPERLDDWLAGDQRLPDPEGTAVHLMMLDRTLGLPQLIACGLHQRFGCGNECALALHGIG